MHQDRSLWRHTSITAIILHIGLRKITVEITQPGSHLLCIVHALPASRKVGYIACRSREWQWIFDPVHKEGQT